MTTGSDALHRSAFWREVTHIPDSLERTLDARSGFDDVAALIARATGRTVLVGNGASFYICQTLAIAALKMQLGGPILAMPVGMLSGADAPLREGDTLVCVSQSGEMRDLLDVVDTRPRGVDVGLLTANAESSLGRRADAVATISILGQDAITHTQAYCASTVALLSVAATAAADTRLADLCARSPEFARHSAAGAEEWATEVVDAQTSPRSVHIFGSGPAWPAAVEAALMVKELALLPSEGTETREAATLTMTLLTPDDLVVSVPTSGHLGAITESERLCAGRGATVRRLPAAEDGPPELAAVTSFTHAAALAGLLAAAARQPLDQPAWVEHYNATARRSEEPS